MNLRGWNGPRFQGKQGKKKGSSVVPVRLRAFVSSVRVPCVRTTSRGVSLQRSARQRVAYNPQIEKELKKIYNSGLTQPWDLGHPIFCCCC